MHVICRLSSVRGYIAVRLRGRGSSIRVDSERPGAHGDRLFLQLAAVQAIVSVLFGLPSILLSCRESGLVGVLLVGLSGILFPPIDGLHMEYRAQGVRVAAVLMRGPFLFAGSRLLPF